MNLPVMAWNGFAESIGPVHSRSVNKNWMEENSVTYKNMFAMSEFLIHSVFIWFITFLHWQFDYWVIVISTNSMIHFVDAFLPIGIVVLMQNSFVSAGQDNQTSIVGRDAFHGSPSADNTIGRTEREVVQIL